MTADNRPQLELEQRIVARVMDAFVRIGLVLVLAFFCYRALAPFLTLLIWSLILAVTLYPLHEAVARKVGGRHGLAATLIAIMGLALIVAPSAVLMTSLGDSVHQFIRNVQSNSLESRRRASPWPPGRSLARNCTPCGPRRTPICQPWCRACSRSSATSRRRHSASWGASASACCCFSPPSSSPASSWRSAKRVRERAFDLPAHRRPGARR